MLPGSVITSTGSGIITYYGDARYLQGMPTSQWIDTDVGLGYTSIFSAGNVGVGTTDPRYTLQVGSTNSSSILTEGVGISSSGYIDLTGGINATGVVTATSFAGFGTDITNISADNISTGLLDNARIPANIDKPTGVGIRLGLGSGVNIEKHPFTLDNSSCTLLISIETVAEGLKSRLVTKLYNLT